MEEYQNIRALASSEMCCGGEKRSEGGVNGGGGGMGETEPEVCEAGEDDVPNDCKPLQHDRIAAVSVACACALEDVPGSCTEEWCEC